MKLQTVLIILGLIISALAFVFYVANRIDDENNRIYQVRDSVRLAEISASSGDYEEALRQLAEAYKTALLVRSEEEKKDMQVDILRRQAIYELEIDLKEYSEDNMGLDVNSGHQTFHAATSSK